MGKRPCYIYFVQEGDSSKFKVGRASHTPDNRVGSLQVGNSSELFLRFAIGPISEPYAKAVEYEFHNRLACFWIRGEWFDLPVLLNGAGDSHIKKWLDDMGRVPGDDRALGFSRAFLCISVYDKAASDKKSFPWKTNVLRGDKPLYKLLCEVAFKLGASKAQIMRTATREWLERNAQDLQGAGNG